MKISGPYPGIPNNEPKSGTSTRGPARPGSFSSFLEKASSNIKAPDTVGPSAPIQFDVPINLDGLHQDIVSQGEKTLEMLDHLGKLLNQPEFSQDACLELSKALSRHTDELAALKNDLDKNDPLRETIKRIEILSLVESYKVSRGDYLD